MRHVLPLSDQMVDALAERFIVGAAFAVAGLAPAALWGFVTACASVVPLFGSALVWLPGSVVLFAAGRPGAAVGLFAFGPIFVSNIDNLMRPIVYRRVSGTGPLVLSYFVELISLYERAAESDRLIAA